MPNSIKTISTKNIIGQLKNKKGLYSYCAKLYGDDIEVASELIFECAEQCNSPLGVTEWGDELINDITEYKKMFGK